MRILMATCCYIFEYAGLYAEDDALPADCSLVWFVSFFRLRFFNYHEFCLLNSCLTKQLSSARPHSLALKVVFSFGELEA